MKVEARRAALETTGAHAGRCKPCAAIITEQGCPDDLCAFFNNCPIRELMKNVNKHDPKDESTPSSSSAYNPSDAAAHKISFEGCQECETCGDPECTHKFSIGHCKPCAFFISTQGCSSGPMCRYCHYCPLRDLIVKSKRIPRPHNPINNPTPVSDADEPSSESVPNQDSDSGTSCSPTEKQLSQHSMWPSPDVKEKSPGDFSHDWGSF